MAVLGTLTLYDGVSHAQSTPPGVPLTNPASDEDLGLITTGTISILTNTGNIFGIFYRGLENQGTIGILNNSGNISSTGPFSSIIVRTPWPTINGLLNTGQIGVVNNTGSISGPSAGLSNSGTIGTLTNDGTISGDKAILNDGFIHTLVNNGTLSGSYHQRFSGDVSMGQYAGLANFGTIDSTHIGPTGNATGELGILNTGVMTELVNAGAISGTLALVAQPFGGTILSGGTAIFNSGAICTLVNTGTIMGVGKAIENTATGTLTQINNAGTIAGTVENLSVREMVINGAEGMSFGTLTGYADTIGTISNVSSSVRFGTGNIALNDHINVASGTVFNDAAALRVDNPISITGNYHQGSAASLLIGIADGAVANGSASDGGYGRLVVSGAAIIAAGSSVTLIKANAYAFAPGQRFVVVQASTNGTQYNESALHYGISGIDAATLHGTAVTTDTHRDLVVTVSSLTATSPAPSGITVGDAGGAGAYPNGNGSTGGTAGLGDPGVSSTHPSNGYVMNGALRGLGAYSGINQPGLLNLYNAAQALTLGSASASHQAEAKLSPTSQGTTARATAAPLFDALTIVSARVDSLRLGGRPSGIATGDAMSGTGPGVWAQAFGGHASQDERDDISGYSANYTGLLFGADKALNEAWRVGGVFSYSHSAINNTDSTAGDTTQSNAYGLIGYAGYTAAQWYVNVSGGAIAQQYDVNRAVNFAGFNSTVSARFPGKTFVARAEAGSPIQVGRFMVTPLASLAYSYSRQNGYTESGGAGAALAVQATHSTSVQTDMGLRFERAFATRYGEIIPNMQLAWRHEYVKARVAVNATYAADPTGETAFSTLGSSPVANSGVMSMGVTLLRANNLSMTLLYQMQATSGYQSKGGSLRMRQVF